jgi:hypothetical protein
MIDPTRTAAAVLLEELAALAGRLAKRLRDGRELPAIAVGRLLVAADKTLTALGRHEARLRPPEERL